MLKGSATGVVARINDASTDTESSPSVTPLYARNCLYDQAAEAPAATAMVISRRWTTNHERHTRTNTSVSCGSVSPAPYLAPDPTYVQRQEP